MVPTRPGNPTRGDPAEGRRRRVAEPLGGNMAGAQEPDPVSTKQQRIAELAKQSPQMGFTSLNHHLDLDWLLEAYNRTRKDGAPGVDGQTDADYGLTLLDNLESLLDRAKSGTYFAPPVRRVHIPKGTGKETRPLGIPDPGGQDPSAGGRHGTGADLRAGLSGLLLRLPSRAIGAHGAGGHLAADDGSGWLLVAGGGHPEVFRHSGSCSSAGTAAAAGA